MNDREIIIGLVKNERFHLLSPKASAGEVVTLTGIKRQESRPPDSDLLILSQYEGCAIAVEGYLDSGWIYDASIIDKGGPIVTALVQQIFG